MVMDRLTFEVRQESSLAMFEDDIVHCTESREQVDVNLERWSYGPHVCEYMGGLSTLESNGGCERKVTAERTEEKERRQSMINDP